MTLWERLRKFFGVEPFDIEERCDSSFPAMPEDLECPDTQPTSPGALDSDLGRLE